MKVKLPSGVVLESDNPTVTDQWKKSGYKEYTDRKSRKEEQDKE
jgi:hypothetical protein